jgi:hypothetical protein
VALSLASLIRALIPFRGFSPCDLITSRLLHLLIMAITLWGEDFSIQIGAGNISVQAMAVWSNTFVLLSLRVHHVTF